MDAEVKFFHGGRNEIPCKRPLSKPRVRPSPALARLFLGNYKPLTKFSRCVYCLIQRFSTSGTRYDAGGGVHDPQNRHTYITFTDNIFSASGGATYYFLPKGGVAKILEKHWLYLINIDRALQPQLFLCGLSRN